MVAYLSPGEVLAWIANIFEIPLDKINPETKKEEIETWDSLGVLTLMARMDEDYHILPTEDEIQQLKSVGDILNLLRKHEVLKDER